MAHLDIEFIKANPSGNTTILVLSPLPREQYAPISQLLMQNNVLAAEQVGFVEKTGTGSHLRMMAGEFCGNASRCYAAWLMMGGSSWLTEGGEVLRSLSQARDSVKVWVSGHEGQLTAWAEEANNPYGCFVEIEMPCPSYIKHGRDTRVGTYSLVGFEGITHVVLWHQATDESLLPYFHRLLENRGLDSASCGLMFVENQQPLTICPLVYIGGMDSLIWEKSCGSGSLAVLCALCDRKKQSYERLPIHQPGGVLLVSANYSAQGITATRLSGPVYFTAKGQAHITLGG